MIKALIDLEKTHLNNFLNNKIKANKYNKILLNKVNLMKKLNNK
jgi:hypothetical protein